MHIPTQPIHSWYPMLDKDGNFIELYGWDVVLRHIFTVLVTRPGSRQWQPEFGCNLLDLLFENASTNENQYADVIRGAFRWIPYVSLQKVNAKLNKRTNGTGYNLSISLTVSYDGETKNVNFVIPPQMDLMNGQIHDIKVTR